jgi:hypothetical protein
MRCLLVLAVCLYPTLAAPTRPDEAPEPRVWLTTSLAVAGDRVPQLAFDGDATTGFQSAAAPQAGDTLTLTLSSPAALGALSVVTGETDGKQRLAAGVLEGSADGTAFETIATLTDGAAEAEVGGKPVKAIRLRATAAGGEPVVVREIFARSQPALPRYRWPVEVVLDCQVDDLRAWADDVRRLAMAWYPFLCELLPSPGFRPARRIELVIKETDGIAATGGARITCAAAWFRKRPSDKGAVIHEVAHVVQAYPRNNAGWLVEGIADWARWWHYEPAGKRPLIPAGGSYREGYQRTGAFLDWLETNRAPGLSVRLSDALRRGQYTPELWTRFAGKDVDALWAEFQAALGRK